METFQIHPEWPQGTAAGWALLCGWFPHRLGCPRLSFIAPNAEASAARPAARGRLATPQGLARTLAPRINAAPGRAGQRVLGDAAACDSASVTPARRRGLCQPGRALGVSRSLWERWAPCDLLDLGDGTFPELWFPSRLPLQPLPFRGCRPTTACPPLSSLAPRGFG